jgi:hypothetical protein
MQIAEYTASIMWALLHWVEPGRGGTKTLVFVSDYQGQFGDDGGKSSGLRFVGRDIVEAGEVLDEGVPRDDDSRGTVSLQLAHRSTPGVEASVVRIERAVRMDLRVVEGCRQQLVTTRG